MAAIENIENVFNILHDGGIEAWTGDKDLLTLTIGCEYLAARINDLFDTFYVELIGITKLELEAWTPLDSPTLIITELNEVFEGDWEILGANIQGNEVIITCKQWDTDLNYSGGNLTISADSIKIYDQARNELTVEEMEKICRAYWTEWRRKCELERQARKQE